MQVKVAGSTTGSGIPHSLCGIPREAEPRTNNQTESFMMAYTPPTDLASSASRDLGFIVLVATSLDLSGIEKERLGYRRDLFPPPHCILARRRTALSCVESKEK